MLKVADYARIRLAHRDGMSIRQIARTKETRVHRTPQRWVHVERWI